MFKKLFVILMLTVMCLCPVMAEGSSDNNEDFHNQDEGETYISPEYQKWLLTHQQSNAKASINILSVSRIAQGDYSAPISTSGCALCCFTMDYNFLTSSNLGADAMYNWLGHVSMQWYNDATTVGITCQAALVVTNGTAIPNICINNIDANRPVIVQLYKSSTGEYHYVIAHGYKVTNSTTIIYIKDPGGNNYTTLAAATTSTGWAVNKYCIYSN